MNCSAVSSNLMPLRILPLQFVLRSSGLNFPEFSGGIWHGGLGMVLAKQSPEAFRRLFQTQPESRLYALRPPIQHKSPEGEQLELRITLFGHGVDHALAVTQAIADLGRIGLRPGGRYELIEARIIAPTAERVYLSEQDGFLAVPCAFAAPEYLAVQPGRSDGCRIHFMTPLRIKEGNNLLRTAPNCTQLLRRIFGRIDQLAHVAAEATPLAKDLREALYDEAGRVEIKAFTLNVGDFKRRSARSGQQMQFDGISGSVDYAGLMQYTLPWLRLACITQLGGKTVLDLADWKSKQPARFEIEERENGMARPAPAINPDDLLKQLEAATSTDNWKTYKCKLVTPLYGGGVKAGEVDKEMPIRATEIRGQLRYWWRIACGPFLASKNISASQEMFRRETEIWGGIGADKPEASKVEVRVKDIRKFELEAAHNAPQPDTREGKNGQLKLVNNAKGWADSAARRIGLKSSCSRQAKRATAARRNGLRFVPFFLNLQG